MSENSSFIERLADSFSRTISQYLNYDEEQKEVIAYGIFVFLHSIWSLVILFAIGYFLGILLPLFFLVMSASILRKFSGGAHCSSANRCTVAGILIYIPLGFLTDAFCRFRKPWVSFLYLFVCLVVITILLFRYCPVDSANKPIKKAEKRKQLRRNSFYFLAFCWLAATILYIIGMAVSNQSLKMIGISITTGLLWQSFTLSPLGHRFMAFVDRVLKYIIH